MSFRPNTERLEGRQLLAIDLVNIAGGTSTTDPGPFGVLEAGLDTSGGLGFSTAIVGDVNGDGFSDFVVGQPSVIFGPSGPAFGSGGNSRAYLVFGSLQVTAQTFDFRNLVPQQRIGDITALGNTLQNNPLNGAPGFAFDGLTFIASQNPTAALGGSVAGVGDVNGDGFSDFMIGAPGANDVVNGQNAAGRAYLVYGGTNLNRVNKQVDFDNPTANSDLNILTFVNNAANAATGRSVASAGDILPDGLADIAIGAPNASLNGLANSGAVYVVSGATLRPARTQTILLQTVGQGGATNTPGVVFTGGTSGDAAGFSVAAGGNFAATTVNSLQQSTLLIGAPQFSVGTGQVSLVYSAGNLISSGNVVSNFSSIVLNRVGATVNGIAGATFLGDNVGDQTGFSVSNAGDFNADGAADILIGSPAFNNAAGRVNLFFGRRATPNPPGPITGFIDLDFPPTGVNQVEFNGVSAGALAGFSISSVGSLNNDAINEILIGSPGFNNNQGSVYVIPGNPDLAGRFNLINTESQPLQGLIIGLSQPANTPNVLGTSVSGVLGTNAAGRTVDGDSISDFVIGSAGFTPSAARLVAGGAFLLEGLFVPLPNIVSTAITSPIGVGKALPPYAINATSPDDLQIFILSAGSNTPGFSPSLDIDPNTITLNGVALPDPTTFQAEPDQDGDGIPDASFVFSPRSLLNLPNGNITFTVAARTLPTSPTPNRRYTGTAVAGVSGSGGGGGGGGLPSFRTLAFAGFGADAQPNMPYGERLVPSNAILRRLSYKAIRLNQAHRQFLPTNGFAGRNQRFLSGQAGSKINSRTLGQNVFNRGRFAKGLHNGRINHKGPTIP